MRTTIVLLWFMIATGAAIVLTLLAQRVYAELKQRVMQYFFTMIVCNALYNACIAFVAYLALQRTSDAPVTLSLVILTFAQGLATVPTIAFSAHLLGLTNGGVPKIKDHDDANQRSADDNEIETVVPK